MLPVGNRNFCCFFFFYWALGLSWEMILSVWPFSNAKDNIPEMLNINQKLHNIKHKVEKKDTIAMTLAKNKACIGLLHVI